MVEALIELKQQAQTAGWLAQTEDFNVDPWSDVHGLYHGKADLLLSPDSTEAVASIMRYCHEQQIKVVVQGGNTGYCGGATPMPENSPQVLLSLRRLNQIRSIDLINQSITVEAGCSLKQIQDYVNTKNRWFPLGLSVADRCLIGGNLATNAGGVNVLRYGNTRDLVLGLEVVLADGEIYQGLQRLRKNNSGYDLKNLFIGSEGTLGVITAAVLKLYPGIQSRALALIGFSNFSKALSLLGHLRQHYQEHLSAFEYWQGNCFEQVTDSFAEINNPFSDAYPHYVLIELSSHRQQDLESLLKKALNAGDWETHISQDPETIQQWWQIRAHLPKAQQQVWSHINSGYKHDISLPLDNIASFLDQSAARLHAYLPDLEIAVFGHLGDGNLHYNVGTKGACLENSAVARVQDIVYEQVKALGGSFSAEHGIGQSKRHLLQQYADPCALSLMRQLKNSLDPHNLLNPSKVL